jgi:hypothetical protein
MLAEAHRTSCNSEISNGQSHRIVLKRRIKGFGTKANYFKQLQTANLIYEDIVVTTIERSRRNEAFSTRSRQEGGSDP